MASDVIVIGGTDYSGYLESLERNATLEIPGATISLVMKPSFPHASIDPWDTLVVTEKGVLTLTGFVSHIVPRRAPAQTEIRGMDTYKRAKDWFIADEYITSGSSGLTVGYYTAYFCNLCGISYSILDSVGSAFVINADIPMGLRSVSDALTQLCAIGQWQMRVNASGTLLFDHIPTASTPDYTISTVETFEEEYNDTDTRNEVKIWGGPPAGAAGVGAGNVLLQETRAVTGISETRAMLFSAPAIDTLAKAQSMATAALNQWARLEHIAAAEIIGNPNLHVGNSLKFSHTRFTSGSFLDTLTDIRSKLDPNGGYQQTLTVGRRAYRYPYWPIGEEYTPPGTVIWQTTGSLGYVQKMATDGSAYLYLVGNKTDHANNTTWRVQKVHATSGSVVWNRYIDNGQNAFGTDILVDGDDLYVSQMAYSTFLVTWFSTIYRMSATTGSTLATSTAFNEFSRQPWMCQDDDYIYKIEGQFAGDGIQRYTKPGLATGWKTEGSVYNAVGCNDNYVVGYDGGTPRLLKFSKADGSTLESFATPPGGGNELVVDGNSVFLLSNTSGSLSNWVLTKYDLGTVDHDPIQETWRITGPNNYDYIGTGHPWEKGLISNQWNSTLVTVGLSFLYINSRFKIDGSMGLDLPPYSTNANDVITTLAEIGRMFFMAGRKNGDWFVQRISG